MKYLPCPICNGVEGCDHTVLDRRMAVNRRRAPGYQLAAALLAFAALWLGSAHIARGQELGKHLAASGFVDTIWVDFDDIRRHDSGRLDASVLWPGAPDCWTTPCLATYEARYGAGSWRRKGTLVGERYSFDALAAYFRLVGIPGLPTRLDREDACLAAAGSIAWWDAVLLRAVAPVVEPPIVAPPVVNPPATFQPVVHPPSGAWASIVAKLEQLLVEIKALGATDVSSTGAIGTKVVPAGASR